MDERRFRLPDQENHFISGHALQKLLRRADGGAALLYLYLLGQKGHLHIPDAMQALLLSEQEVYAAVGVLATLGLISGGDAAAVHTTEKPTAPQQQDPPQADELPQYTAAELDQEMSTDPGFAALVKEVGGILNKILTAPDLNTLMGIYRHLGLPLDVMFQLVSHLTKEHRERYGEGKSPTLRGIEKIAYIWAREEIFTLEQAVAHIDRRERMKSEIGLLKKALDIKQDKLTPSQEKYLHRWLELNLGPEVIALAYDRTMVQTGSLQWKYLDAIVTDWHKKGLTTIDDIEAAEPSGDTKPRRGKAAAPTPSAPDRDEIARRRRLLEQMNGGDTNAARRKIVESGS
ncbi:MAG: DnaD domain protein [Oscillospiraceae bacterium]|nr:DnaD domain protein [Oscillospiraceae bacterium]